MTIEELTHEYEKQYRLAVCKADALAPLLCIYGGKELERLEKRIRFYYDMACECKNTAFMLGGYKAEDDMYDELY